MSDEHCAIATFRFMGPPASFDVFIMLGGLRLWPSRFVVMRSAIRENVVITNSLAVGGDLGRQVCLGLLPRIRTGSIPKSKPAPTRDMTCSRCLSFLPII